MNDRTTLDTLRRRGILGLTLVAWLCVPLLLIWGWVLKSPNVMAAMGVAALVNIPPTIMVVRRRHDAVTRMMFGGLAAILPALFVYLLEGNTWQMDAHMYFFVALSALAVLCDWRPIVVGATLVALHHLSFTYIAPTWVFDRDGDVGRVLFHALAVVLQVAALCYLTIRLRALIIAQEAARRDSEVLAATAETERARAIAALAAATAAEKVSATERARRHAVEQRLSDERRSALALLAEQFESSVAGVAVAIEAAALRLEGSAGSLNAIAADAGRQASDVAAGAVQAATATQNVADAVHRLTQSIATVAGSAEDQATLTRTARISAASGDARVRTLAERAGDIGGFVGEIHGIAARTNLLALNATIEAARAGEAGRGFAVVADEVKQLAGGTSRATDKIVVLIDSMRDGVDTAAADLAAASDAVAHVAAAADSIRDVVDQQRGMADAIERTAHDAARGVDVIEQRISGVAKAASAADALSREVNAAAATLGDHARILRRATDEFVAQLQGGEAA